MKFRNPWIDPRVLLVKSADARAYLLKHGWKLLSSESNPMLHFEGPPGDGCRPSVWVPMREQAGDYPQRIIELISDLAQVEDRYAVEVLNDILGQSAESVPTIGSGVSLPSEPASK